MAMETKNKIMLGVVIGLGVVAVVGVIVGVTTHSEPGLMSVCWGLDGAVNYDTENCASPEEIRWSRNDFPLVVDGPPESEEILTAISMVNDQIGCTLFRFEPGSGSRADVTVILDDVATAGTDRAGGSTSHTRTFGGSMFATVRTYWVSDPYLKMRTLVHEFGHVLGLAHDLAETSIMYPTQSGGRTMDFVMFSDSDQNLLNGLYCHNE